MIVAMNKLKDKIIKFIPWFKDNWPELKEKATSTQGIITGAVSVLVLFVVVMIVQSCTPRKGTILYGMCKSFLEVQIPFPETIEHSFVEQYRKAIRIYFTHTDPFGQYQMEYIECSFFQDAAKGVQLESVYFDHVKKITETTRAPGKGRLYAVKEKHIEMFNNSRSPAAIVKNNPDLTLPD